MERLGKLVEWNDARGYGFIVPIDAPGQRYFLHVHEYRRMGRRPEVGELLRFVPERQPDGRWRAVDVARAVSVAHRQVRAAAGRQRNRGAPSSRLPALLLAVLGGLLAWAAWRDRLPTLLPAGLLAVNAVTFIAYWIDKRAAQAQRRRTPEATLHLLELLGGWPAAWLAQRVLRHKSRKESYQLTFLAAALLNLAAIALLLIREPGAA
jgi:uncharacterized membrane protein YsdA (DUF1294 family)